ncbi:hypothetical protein ACSYAD_36540, partial [Acaryochloris marina NIES-2412]|uniref:hypothetical protein n=1 Tax=Acaryochloris marina TaxID=155978 RepID=UPI004058D275
SRWVLWLVAARDRRPNFGKKQWGYITCHQSAKFAGGTLIRHLRLSKSGRRYINPSPSKPSN